MADSPFARIRPQLDELAARGRAVLRRWALNEAVRTAAPWLFPAAVPVPALYLLAAASRFAGGPAWPLGPWGTGVLAVAVPVAACAVRAAHTFCTRPIERRLSLALYDRELDAHDRIQAADEFLRAGPRGGFRLAAVADAQSTIERALATELPPPKVAVPALHPGPWRWGATALAAFLLALLLSSGDPVVDAGGEVELAASGLPVDPRAEAQQAQEAAIRRNDAERQARPAERLTAEEVREISSLSMQPRLADERQPPSAGRAGGASREAGRNAADRAASSASGRSPTEPQERATEQQDRRESGPRPQSPPPEEDNDSSTGIAAGMGGSSGSRTSESDRESTDSKAERDQDDDDVPDDAEEEEDEEQEATAAMRPLLNQRKAPVDRSLIPSGAGEQQENPDANGRSGPGGLKKTRGVAAMLLGVPMPDQLLGHVNPGRMKVQRERAEPQERDSAPYLAEERVAMDESAGKIARDDFTLPMQNLIRDYFLARRQAKDGPVFDSPTEATP